MRRLVAGVVVAAWSAAAWAQPAAVAPLPVSGPPAAASAPANPAPTVPVPPQAPYPYSPPAYPSPYSPPAPQPAPGAPVYPAPVYYYPPPYPLPVYEPPEPPQAPPPMTTFSLTIAPLYLLFPVVALTGELRLGTQGGVALIAGGGRVTVTQADGTDHGTKVTFRVYEVGGQLRYYVTGDFRRGMQIGAEILYLHVNGSLEDVTGVAKGLGIGPFFGWKTTSYAGFTFEVQGGVQIVTSGTKVTDSNGGSTSSSVDYVPLVNLNIGWSF